MPSPAAVTALGLATSLGLDAVTAAAAARAGIVRTAPLPVWIESPETRDPEPVAGHAVEGLADGFEGPGRLLHLADLALADLLRSVDATALRGAHWLAALPEALPAAPPPGVAEPGAAPSAVGPGAPRLAPARVHALLEHRTGLAIPPHRFAAFDGRVGWVRAMGHAARLAERGGVSVVCALDSLVDAPMIRALHAHGRLLVAGGAVGLQPGEAAAFAVVAPEGGPAPLVRLGAGALGDEPHHLYSGRPAGGRGLAETVGRLPPGGPLWPVADGNGEAFRAAEWGHAVARSAPLRASLAAAWYPATSVGDTGAASAAVGLAFAARAFARGYAPAPTALLLAADATGPCGALALHAP